MASDSKQKQISLNALEFLLLEINTENDFTAQFLDSIGFRIGYSLVEKMTKDKIRFTDTLDIVKFICKEFWIAVFQKQIDNLKTNHRGVYVLSDNSFKWISKLSSNAIQSGSDDISLHYQHHLTLPCAIIRGALVNLGVHCSVIAELLSHPQVQFQIKLK